ncbi:uncharacterized protein [Apostichopus japonicus]|uniref:uncharacterized protein isoform X2 n=1 Tax=Stichopus japonicus TaxID=307972 RepID=UPI003AB75CE4
MRMGNLRSKLKTLEVDSSDEQDIGYEEPSISSSAQAAQASVTSSQSTERPTFVVRTDNVTSTITWEQDKTAYLVNALKRQYRTQYDAIQPIPYIKERLYCVDKVFLEGGTEFYSVRGTTDEGCEWVRVDSYRDIFTDSRIKSKRRIVEAEAGYGKSTVTLQLAYDWCNGVEGSPMKDVEILILLRLRQLGNIKSIYKAIKLFLLADEPRIKSSDIKNIIERCSSVELLLDGYDEYPDKDRRTGSDVDRIITNDLFEHFDVSLTTRYPPKDYDRYNTKRVRLVGFDKKARDQYIRKAVAGDDEKIVEEIKRALKANPILDDLCKVPIFFVMFAHMTHEKEYFQTFKSVTEFFRHMIQCFHNHMRKKSLDKQTRKHMSKYEIEHTELSNVAFEGLSNENQQLSWGREKLGKRLGQGFYDHYVLVGILVEEEVADVTNEMTPANKHIQTKTEARFYHKLFCEYFASFALVVKVAAARNATKVKKILDKIDPFDLQYLYRFSCGIDAKVGSKIIEYLKGRKDGDKFAILCILEQAGEIDDDIKKSVREICSKLFLFSNWDGKLLQRSSIQLLDIASKCDIPIVDLYLNESLSKADKDNIVLRSGLSLGNLSTVVKIDLYTEKGRELTEEDVIGLLLYAEQSKDLRELWIRNCPQPESIHPNHIAISLKTSNLKVVSQNSGSCLDLHSGQWMTADDVDTITKLCLEIVTIANDDSELQQGSIIQLMEKASSHNIPIYVLSIFKSFSHVDECDVILRSGLRLSGPSSVCDVSIYTEDGREMTQQEIFDILMYIQQSQRLTKLTFFFCLLPELIPVRSIPSAWLSKDITVQWFTHRVGHILDLRTGAWLVSIFNNIFQGLVSSN